MAKYSTVPRSLLPRRPRGWGQLAVVVAVLAVGAFLSWRERQDERAASQPGDAPPPAVVEQHEGQPAALRTTVGEQTIRDLEGKVAFQGEIDVGTTLARIQAGTLLDFPNDGATFQNRERRLPRKPAGYYKEYVHPTPGLRGPGPQRIVAGEGGEFYYTPDHYRTFRKLDLR
jgi:guanyl-specific ribonuclease Sa